MSRGGTRGRRGAAAAGLLALGLLFAGCGGSGSASEDRSNLSAADEQGFVSGDGTLVVLPVDERRPAPQIRATALTGEPFDLGRQRGRVVVLNVWASWCAPCRQEAPDLQQVWAEAKSDDVQFVGLNTRDTTAAATAFAVNYGLTYPQLPDPDGRIQLQFRDTLPPQAIPSTLVVDKEGRVAGRALGAVSASALRGLIEPLLAEPGPSPAGAALVVDPAAGQQ